MRNSIEKIISATLSVYLCFALFCITSGAETDETIPMLTREYIQYTYEKVYVNHNFTVFITVIIFALLAILIPAAFYLADKIQKRRVGKTSPEKKQKK